MRCYAPESAGGRRSAGGCGAVEPLEELPGGPEMHVPLGSHLHGLPSSWIAAQAGDPDPAEEAAHLPRPVK